MKFIFNFIFFGVLFYAIHLLFPDAFKVLVTWADSIYELLRDLVIWLTSKVQDLRNGST